MCLSWNLAQYHSCNKYLIKKCVQTGLPSAADGILLHPNSTGVMWTCWRSSFSPMSGTASRTWIFYLYGERQQCHHVNTFLSVTRPGSVNPAALQETARTWQRWSVETAISKCLSEMRKYLTRSQSYTHEKSCCMIKTAASHQPQSRIATTRFPAITGQWGQGNLRIIHVWTAIPSRIP